MEIEELLARLGAAEDNFVERKPEGANRSELRRTVVAFANSTPEGQIAVLFLGLHDKGMIIGVQNPDALQKTIGDVCGGDIYPPVDFFSRAIQVDGKTVVAICVPSSRRKPHFAGPAFVRRGSESVVASVELYEELIASRVDKCRQILAWRGQIITVTSVQHNLACPSGLPIKRTESHPNAECSRATPTWFSLKLLRAPLAFPSHLSQSALRATKKSGVQCS